MVQCSKTNIELQCIQRIEAFSMLEAKKMTQNSGAHLCKEGDPIHVCQINSIGAWR